MEKKDLYTKKFFQEKKVKKKRETNRTTDRRDENGHEGARRDARLMRVACGVRDN